MLARALTMLSDERLAQLAAGGSDPAFAALYNRYSGTLFAYCRSITRNADDGWDALQNAMIKVLVALRRAPERDAPVRPWLFCICHNESIGVLRRRTAAERVAGASTCAVSAGADELALMREHVTETVSDVQQLPTGQRAALVMRELADLRYDEIAIALETTEGNARQLVFAARAGLRDSRAGRGLPCESVRDQLSLADGRLLRRRSVRAHLRTCDGCREYAVSVRRRAGEPAARVAAWSPLAGYQVLDAVFRAAPAAIQGGWSLGPLAVKAATAGALVVAGLGAADVATQVRPERSTAPKAATSATRSHAPAALASKASPAAATRAAVVHAEPAVYRPASVSASPATVMRPKRQRSAPVRGTAEPRVADAPARPQRQAALQPAAEPDPPRQQRQRQPARAPAPAASNCDGAGRQRPAQAQHQQPPVREQQTQTREQVAFDGDAQARPTRDRHDFAGAR